MFSSTDKTEVSGDESRIEGRTLGDGGTEGYKGQND